MKPYYEHGGITIYHGDYREVVPICPCDVILTDPPYGMTQNDWDTVVNLSWWWDITPSLCGGAIVFTASQPFTSLAVTTGLKYFKHEWIWRKNRGSNFANTVREPFKEHESVVVFAARQWTYNPQKQPRRGSGAERAEYKVAWNPGGSNYREFAPRDPVELSSDRVPSSVQDFNTETGLHPTQKPEKLFSYLCATYSNPRDIVLDPFCGSGTTLKAAKALGRKAIGIEIEEKYCEIAAKRLSQEVFHF
jgi:site-specific DNA-methyltransferase (adenine-specific)